jgi:hypothetical protein
MKMKFDHRFVAAFNTFIDSLKGIVAKETAGQQSPHGPYSWTVEYEEGYKYIRVVIASDNNGNKQKTAWGFIDKRSADIFRAASWKAPSLNHIRGNLYDESNGLKNAHWTGPAYIWEINGSKEDAAVSEVGSATGAD